MASISKSATWSGDSRFSLIMNLNETYVSDGANNYSDISWNLQLSSTSSYRTYTTYAENPLVAYINGVQVCNTNISYDLQNNTITVASGSIRITHSADGSKTIGFNASFSDVSNGKGSANLSGDLTLTKINRYAITNSVLGSDIDGNFSVNYTKYLNDYKFKLRIFLPNIMELERIDYDISDTPFQLSQETIETLYSRYTNTNTFSLGFAVEAWTLDESSRLYSGNQKIITAKITGANPIFADFDYADINATTLALTGNSKYNINGYSTIRVTISTTNKAVAQKGASMVKYRFIIGDTTKEVAYSDNSDVYIDIPNSSIGTYQVYAIDSRNNATLVTKLSLSNIEYTPLYLDKQNSYTERDDGGIGENVTLTYSGNIWNNSFGSVSNAITLAKYEFKEVDSETWITGTTNITPTITNNTFSFSNLIRSNLSGYIFDESKSYNFRITLEDKLSSTMIELTPLPSGRPNISLNKNGVGIMCDYDESLGGLLQIGGELYTNNNGKILWTNSSPSSDMSTVDINLNSSDYDLLLWICKEGTTSTELLSSYTIKGYGVKFNNISGNNINRRRTIVYVNDTKYRTQPVYGQDGNNYNGALIPIYVIGYDTGLF